MKKIFLIVSLLISVIYAKPCMIDIYFGNGVWNTERQAIAGMKALRSFMKYKAVIRLDPKKEGDAYIFKYAYNPTHGTRDDLIETFWQLKESGQISSGYFMLVYAVLAGEDDYEEFLKKLQEVVNNYNIDASSMYNLYKYNSFNKNHNVLLVSHSQGNLFGNKMYTLMSDNEKKKFRMVSVATPANHVMKTNQKSPYVTASNDFVINPIPGSLPANVDGFGHTFIGTYLGSSINAPRKIALYIKNEYDYLLKNALCSQYEMTKVEMPSFGILKIYGKPFNIYTWEEIATLKLPQKDAKKINGSTTCNPTISLYIDNQVWPEGDKDYWANSSGFKRIKWLPGSGITNKKELDSRSYVSDNVLNEESKKCIQLSLKKGTNLYNILESGLMP